MALIFTLGALINVHRKPEELNGELVGRGSGPRRPTFMSPHRQSRQSRVLARYPFVLEAIYWNLTYWPYQLARALSARIIASTHNRYGIYNVAESHAMAILRVEEKLRMAVEQPTQYHILSRAPWLRRPMQIVYTSHIIVGVAFIAYAYTYFPRLTFQRIRRTLFVDNWLAFVLLTIYRCMPPRMLSAQYGFVDVLHPKLHSGEGEPVSWSNNRYQLTIAAMPSLHFGTSVLVGWSLYRYAPQRVLRLLGPLWPALMLLTVVGTANHFLLDCIAGAAVVWVGWRVQRLVLYLQPLEQVLFWLLSIERPKSADVMVRVLARSASWEFSEGARHIEEAKNPLSVSSDSEESIAIQT